MSKIAERMSKIKHKLLVLSGKGGVGKSTVTAQIALSLVRLGYKVGVLDLDICGPSIPKIFGLEAKDVLQSELGWIPVYADETKSLGLMSIAFLIKSADEAIVWRGPRKNAMIQQFLGDVFWGDLDFLIIDTPPGTSDEHISVAEMLVKDGNPDGAVVVTTPQGVSLSDVRKELTFCERASLKVLGLIENMSGFVCPHCKECTEIFMTGGGENLATTTGYEFLGRIPIDPELSIAEDEGKNFADLFPDAPSTQSLKEITRNVLKQMGIETEEKENHAIE